jgi:small subunit ribosomal protein S4
MLRKHKKYSRPRKPFDKARIEEENEIIKKFGLKNKREIWRADAQIVKIRRIAKTLITESVEKQKEFFDTLNKKGLNINSIAEVLALTKEDYLNRRLQTIVSRKFARTIKTARQMITHRNVTINGKIIDVPSYVVLLEEEGKIKFVEQKKKEKPKKVEAKKEVTEVKETEEKKEVKEEKIEGEKKDE